MVDPLRRPGHPPARGDRAPPKPMVEIGVRPILWHIMKLYGPHGFQRFVLCLGYKGWEIKQYFLRYHEMLARLHRGAWTASRPPQFHNADGERELAGHLRRDRGRHGDRRPTLARAPATSTPTPSASPTATPSADVDIDALLDFHHAQGRIATVTGVHPTSRYGEIEVDGRGSLEFTEKPTAPMASSRAASSSSSARRFDYLDDDPQLFLEHEPLQRPRPRRPALGLRARGLLAPDGHLPRLPPPQRALEAGAAAVEGLVR